MFDNIPECCKACKHLYRDWDYCGYTGHGECLLGVWLPTKKQACKKQVAAITPDKDKDGEGELF